MMKRTVTGASSKISHQALIITVSVNVVLLSQSHKLYHCCSNCIPRLPGIVGCRNKIYQGVQSNVICQSSMSNNCNHQHNL
mgnify:CR=1 FL=1